MKKLQLRKASRDLVRSLGALETHYGNFSLPPVQVHTLVELGQERLTISQIATKLKIDRSNAQRTLTSLAKQLLIESITNPNDARCQLYRLTEKGQQILDSIESSRNKQVQAVIDQFDNDELNLIESSLAKYIKALSLSNIQCNYNIRPIAPSDNEIIATIIREVSSEYGLSEDKGFSVADPTLDSLYQVYEAEKSQYWVLEKQGKIYGGAGIAPVAGESDICELQKMYFLPEARGKGLARTIAVTCFKQARKMGYSKMYLETTNALVEAVALYQSLGFEVIDEPIGNTGHTDCEIRMLKIL
ncbi:bifunctional helix-turn-helix transcriptional regulator/GNAT family N-acetyltransferase [Vibrio sp. TH_r3]|uniref:bifunctional helix-turn-helix transcriptional regulator/GNAT family N-acetyltransferase n=1 Tax=Vibrio sp. TH_r3 TaxID=3082084 RepID=UPI0029540A38|nr:bifunctional helix-turn-helix transcriptional regulator/GNAT family N-acetyltransferase [Vibrio sp. TH_r3]MDV7105415.1 bifunctional helix-turn-helix transcriptional regulator/GNAT family N-acetyltransferase [Vibrio sp. TH_r3]